MPSIINILLSLLIYLPGNGKDHSAFTASIRKDSTMPVLAGGKAIRTTPLSIETIMHGKVAAKGMLGFSQKGRIIEAWYFPGLSDQKALVIGGVHGSELSSIEVANTLIKQLQKKKPYYSVIVIPCLFPDNAEIARSGGSDVGGTHNNGRYSHHTAADPNRQMPSLGKAYRPDRPLDHLGRPIEHENQMLLKLIEEFAPERIANIHAIRDANYAGIYADPRTNSEGIALGFESDSMLAISMAMHIQQGGGHVAGNRLDAQVTAVYYKDPAAVPAGNFQKRNTTGASLPLNRGRGISLGSWGSTAVKDAVYPAGNRDAMRIITVEFPGYKAPAHYADATQQQYFSRLVQLYATSIFQIFLGE